MSNNERSLGRCDVDGGGGTWMSNNAGGLLASSLALGVPGLSLNWFPKLLLSWEDDSVPSKNSYKICKKSKKTTRYLLQSYYISYILF